MFDHLVWLEEVNSTQDVLRKGSFPKGTVVVANRQKKGKGRKGRRWESQEGGLYFSFVLFEEDFKEVVQIPLVVGLSVSEVLEDLGVGAVLKWPNDVYARGRKIAGILVEKSGRRIITGVGLNVNQRGFGEGMEDVAVSLYQLTGRESSKPALLCRLLDRIALHLQRFGREGFAPFKAPVEERLIFRGEEVIVLSERSEVGILKGIDEEGYLLLQTSEGDRRIAAGDVSLRLHL